MTAAASRPLRKDAARNRAALLEAARAVFAERGLDASLDDIAHHAGVGVGTAYRHFANKYELAGAILREAVEEIVGLAHDCVEMDDPWEGLIRFLEGSCVAQIANRGLHEVLMGMHDESLAEEASEQLIEPLTALVDRAHASGCTPSRDRRLRRRHRHPLPHHHCGRHG
jgi:AcrR family transcriptional regulator